MVRVVIADDHALVRRGLKRLIDAHEGYDVIGEASSGSEALEVVRRLTPDVLILDLSMPQGDGFQVLDALAEARAPVRVLVVSAHVDSHHVRFAREAGAHEVLSKGKSSVELIAAISRVAEMPPGLVPHSDGAKQISRREFQVLVPLAEGKTNHEIALELGVSVKTIDTHRRKILNKLDLRNNAELTRYAIREGVIDP